MFLCLSTSQCNFHLQYHHCHIVLQCELWQHGVNNIWSARSFKPLFLQCSTQFYQALSKTVIIICVLIENVIFISVLNITHEFVWHIMITHRSGGHMIVFCTQEHLLCFLCVFCSFKNNIVSFCVFLFYFFVLFSLKISSSEI